MYYSLVNATTTHFCRWFCVDFRPESESWSRIETLYNWGCGECAVTEHQKGFWSGGPLRHLDFFWFPCVLKNNKKKKLPPSWYHCIDETFFLRRRPLSRQRRHTGIRVTGSASFRARGGSLLDHLYAPRHPPSAPPMGERQGVNSQTAGIRWVVMINIFWDNLYLLIYFFIYGYVCNRNEEALIQGHC